MVSKPACWREDAIVKVFITGHLGMIGSLGVVPILEEKGVEWTGYDLLEGRSIMSLHLLTERMQGCDVVIHLAAIPCPHYPEKTALDYYRVNVLGSYNVFLAAERNGVKKVIYPSSMAIYGDPFRVKYVPIDMEHPTLLDWDGREPYAKTKLIVERMIRGFPFTWIVIRFGSVNEHRPWIAHCPIGETVKIHPRDVGMACYNALFMEENKLLNFCKPQPKEVIEKAISHIINLNATNALNGGWPFPKLEVRGECSESLFDLKDAKELLGKANEFQSL